MTLSAGLSILFALPRSRSTAFFRAMATQPDLICIHEPFCSLSDTGSAKLPDGLGGSVTYNTQNEVVGHICDLAKIHRVFVKETTDSDLTGLTTTGFFASDVAVAFLVRAPGAAIASHLKMRAEAGISDFGFSHLCALMERMKANEKSITLYQSEGLAANPAKCLSDFCDRANLNFTASMLSWEPEDRIEWQRTRNWHSAVAKSEGFCKTAPVNRPPYDLVETVTPDYLRILDMGGVTPITEGGCHCGSVRYHLWEKPRDLAVCHCTICRSTSGAPHVGWGSVGQDAFTLVGKVTQYESSKGCFRQFCICCGTQITFVDDARPEEIDFTIASLNDAELYRPVTALHTDFKLAWDFIATDQQAFSNHRITKLVKQERTMEITENDN